jgi:hypothetical protein
MILAMLIGVWRLAIFSFIPLCVKKRLQLLKELQEPSAIIGLDKYIKLFIELLHALLIEFSQSNTSVICIKKRLQLQARLDQLEEAEITASNIWQQDSISSFVTLLHDIIAFQESDGKHPILQRLI